MAITATNLTNGGSSTDGTSFSTASITPGSNRLVLLSIAPCQSSGATVPTVTGNGLTWVAIDGGEYGGAGSGRQVHLFRAMGSSPSAAAVNMSFGTTQLSVAWSVDEYDGVDTSGTNGSGAIVQSVKDIGSSSSTSLTLTLAAFGSANNVAHGMFSHSAAEAMTVGSGFTSLSSGGITSPTMSLLTEYKANDTTVDATWSSSVSRGGIAAEIKAAAAAAATIPQIAMARTSA